MLGIILLILKIILWIILGILGLLLLLILMILFVPIRYSGMFSKCETIRAKGKISYLLNIFRILVEFKDGELKYKVKVLFFTVMKEGYDEAELEEKAGLEQKAEPKVKAEVVPKEHSKSEKEKLAKQAEVVPKMEKPKAIEAKIEQKPEAKTLVKADDVKKEKAKKDKTQKDKSKIDKTKKDKVKKKKTKKSKKKTDETEESSFEKVKRFYGFLKKAENRGLFKFVLRMLGKILKSILPKKIEGRLNIGTDDPALTGYILAVVSSMYPIYQENFVITPDFEGPRVEGNVKGRGRIIIVIIVFYAVRVILDRRVRRLIKEAKK